MKKIVLALAAASVLLTSSVFAAKKSKAKGKVWIIATDTVFRPFEYTNEKNKFVGIDVDLLAAIAEDQGFAYDLQSLDWDAGVAAVQVGQADGLIAGATIKQSRIDSGWIFSDGYYNATQTFVVAKDSKIAKYEDFKGKTVALFLRIWYNKTKTLSGGFHDETSGL